MTNKEYIIIVAIPRASTLQEFEVLDYYPDGTMGVNDYISAYREFYPDAYIGWDTANGIPTQKEWKQVSGLRGVVSK